MRTTISILLATAALAGCASDSGTDDGLIDGFEPAPVAAGYKRYVTPAVKALEPGKDVMLCQWLDVPADHDLDVIDVTGMQTVAGHHAVLYSTSKIEPVGTSRECTVDDMVSVEFLGGVGGEGVSGNATKLPEGTVFRFGQRRALMANVHYYNTGDDTVDVQSVVDVKLADPSAEYKPVGMTGINVSQFTIPANTDNYVLDAYCTWPRTSSLIMWSVHEHAYGTKVYSEVKRANSDEKLELARDDNWSYEKAFNPEWEHWDLSSPRMLHQGDEVHVHCEWSNNTGSPVRFPDEMCVGLGFYLESSEQVICDAQPKP